MSEAEKTSEGDFPDPKGLQRWLETEIELIQKASELRIKEATRFVNDYARGEISKDEAAKRCYEYSERWGDALPGVAGTRGLSDKEILAAVDSADDPNFVKRLIQEQGSAGRQKKT